MAAPKNLKKDGKLFFIHGKGKTASIVMTKAIAKKCNDKTAFNTKVTAKEYKDGQDWQSSQVVKDATNAKDFCNIVIVKDGLNDTEITEAKKMAAHIQPTTASLVLLILDEAHLKKLCTSDADMELACGKGCPVMPDGTSPSQSTAAATKTQTGGKGKKADDLEITFNDGTVIKCASADQVQLFMQMKASMSQPAPGGATGTGGTHTPSDTFLPDNEEYGLSNFAVVMQRPDAKLVIVTPKGGDKFGIKELRDARGAHVLANLDSIREIQELDEADCRFSVSRNVVYVWKKWTDIPTALRMNPDQELHTSSMGVTVDAVQAKGAMTQFLGMIQTIIQSNNKINGAHQTAPTTTIKQSEMSKIWKTASDAKMSVINLHYMFNQFSMDMMQGAGYSQSQNLPDGCREIPRTVKGHKEVFDQIAKHLNTFMPALASFLAFLKHRDALSGQKINASEVSTNGTGLKENDGGVHLDKSRLDLLICVLAVAWYCLQEVKAGKFDEKLEYNYESYFDDRLQWARCGATTASASHLTVKEPAAYQKKKRERDPEGQLDKGDSRPATTTPTPNKKIRTSQTTPNKVYARDGPMEALIRSHALCYRCKGTDSEHTLGEDNEVECRSGANLGASKDPVRQTLKANKWHDGKLSDWEHMLQYKAN